MTAVEWHFERFVQSLSHALDDEARPEYIAPAMASFVESCLPDVGMASRRSLASITSPKLLYHSLLCYSFLTPTFP